MSGFNTKEKNDNGEYEITFYTENRQDFEKVQDLCRELIGHGKPISNEGDLISREALKKHIIDVFETEEKIDKKWAMGLKYSLKIIDKASTVCGNNPKWCESCVSKGKCASARPQGEWARHDEWVGGEYVGGFYHVNCPCIDLETAFYSKWRTNFCPNCGAYMKGGAE